MRILNIKVKTGQPEFMIDEKGGETTVSVKAQPENDEANRELVREFTKRFGRTRIVRGFKSAHKTLSIED
jgi:uncharacterized protein (TIGR00251 family)